MKNKRRRQPFDPKTGRAVFTPVLRATGERLDLEVDYGSERVILTHPERVILTHPGH
jgi:hypothetical protein